jgi:thioredoxin-like negative regulator of GroEL
VSTATVDIATDPICQEALALAGPQGAGGDTTAAVDRLIAMVGPDRAALVAARDAFARRLHAQSDDYAATAALRLLNRSLSKYSPPDPYDWHRRFGHRLIKP